MKNIFLGLLVTTLVGVSAYAQGYQHGWKTYDKPQPGATYGGYEANPYGPGGSKSYGPGGGNSYGEGGGKNPLNPWKVTK